MNFLGKHPAVIRFVISKYLMAKGFNLHSEHGINVGYFMVDVAQLVERRIVIPVVVGSSPITHPIFLRAVSSVGRAADS